MALPIWAGTVKTTIAYYERHVERILWRYRPELAMCLRLGEKKYGGRYASHEYRWFPQLRRITGESVAIAEPVTFQRHQLEEQAVVGPIKRTWNTMLAKEDKAISKSRQGLIDLVKERQKDLEQGSSRELSEQLLTNDGGAAATGNLLHGTETFFAHNAANADGKRRDPNDNYAGLSTNHGDQGGSDETDDEFVVWSPTIVDYTGTGWAVGQADWESRCLIVLNYAMQKVRYRNDEPNFVDAVFLHPDMFTAVTDKLEAKQEVVLERGRQKSKILDFGFEAIEYRGSEIIPTYSAPADTGYGISCKNICWWSIFDKLINMETDYQTGSQTFVWLMSLVGNVIFKSPNRHFKLINAT